jgi:hypothetical protein
VPAVHDPAKVWRRRLRVGSHAWAERRDGTWVRWSWLHADWEDMPGPPEGVRAAPPEGSVIAAPPAFATAKSSGRPPRTVTDRLLEYAVPAMLMTVAATGLLTAGALIWNGLIGPFMGMIPIGGLWVFAGLTCLVVTVGAVAVELALIRMGKGLRELLTPGPKGRRR